jgi:hypothetical protein
MKIKIIAVLIISAAMVSFASGRVKKNTAEKSQNTAKTSASHSRGFVSEEL